MSDESNIEEVVIEDEGLVDEESEDTISNLVSHAERELRLLVDGDPEASEEDRKMQNEINAHIIELVKLFSKFGHSGSTAYWSVAVLKRLLSYEPLTPLTGEDWEWNEVAEQNGGPLYQNNRCGNVFKDNTGAYDIDGRIFVDPAGNSYTNFDSRVYIEFPYTPRSEYVDVDAEGNEIVFGENDPQSTEISTT